MKQIVVLGLIGLSIVLLANSCGQTGQSDTKKVITMDKADSGDVACEKNEETIKYPNETKPMAQMMRTMVSSMLKMQGEVMQQKQLDSLKYPFIRFYLVEPTDKSVLEPAFFENARLFQQAYLELFKHPKEQVKYYNLVVGKCINCHENYCSGPLKRIRKLIIKP